MNPRKTLIREIVLAIITGKEKTEYKPTQLANLAASVTEVLSKRKIEGSPGMMNYGVYPQLSADDMLILSEVFWDLLIERIITPGMDSSNLQLPWFRLHSEAKID